MPQSDTQPDAAPPARWSFGLDGGWRVVGNLSAMGAVVMMMFLLRADGNRHADEYQQGAERAHREAAVRNENMAKAVYELTAETRASRIELQGIRVTNERTERFLSGAEVPWWMPPKGASKQ